MGKLFYTKGSKFIFEIPLEVEKSNASLSTKKESRNKSTIEVTRINSHSSQKVEKLFAELKRAAEKSRPQLCKPIVEELENCELTPKDAILFDKVKALLKKYKFHQAGELL